MSEHARRNFWLGLAAGVVARWLQLLLFGLTLGTPATAAEPRPKPLLV